MLFMDPDRFAQARRPQIAAFRRRPSILAGIRSFAAHSDPLAEASNWIALTIGSHLPFWPLYVLFAVGRPAWPTSLLTAAMAPFFLVLPVFSRRSSLLGRIATPMLGVANTIFTICILGINSGTEVFLFPCAALAALSFRRSERWLMVALTAVPPAIWYVLRQHPPIPLHLYDPAAAHRLFVLNVFSIAVIVVLFGWLQTGIYRRMETRELEDDPHPYAEGAPAGGSAMGSREPSRKM